MLFFLQNPKTIMMHKKSPVFVTISGFGGKSSFSEHGDQQPYDKDKQLRPKTECPLSSVANKTSWGVNTNAIFCSKNFLSHCVDSGNTRGFPTNIEYKNRQHNALVICRGEACLAPTVIYTVL